MWNQALKSFVPSISPEQEDEFRQFISTRIVNDIKNPETITRPDIFSGFCELYFKKKINNLEFKDLVNTMWPGATNQT